MSGLDTLHISEYQPLRDVVFHALREAIITGELKPGDRLMETSLAERMGVSRTPVREAIRKLELEGFVVKMCIRDRDTSSDTSTSQDSRDGH